MDLEEVKKHWYSFHNLNATHINWLIEQAEKAERYEKAMNELKEGFNTFGEITGDRRFVEGVKKAKEKYNL